MYKGHKFCRTHTKYLAKRKPKIPCEACWRAWILRTFVRQLGAMLWLEELG